MVRGFGLFTAFFFGFEDRFVLIGGAACDVWLSKEGLRARATKDLDLVLVVESVDAAFAERFWEFIKEGRYERSEAAVKSRRYYRFSKPGDERFPSMLELFSRHPDSLPLNSGHLTSIPVEGDVSSLSAILLDDEAYRFILDCRSREHGMDILRPEGLIPLKAKAFVELSDRRNAGEAVDEDDIQKHKRDIVRLASILPVGCRVALPAGLRAEMVRIMDTMIKDPPDWESIGRSLGIPTRMDPDRGFALLRSTYYL